MKIFLDGRLEGIGVKFLNSSYFLVKNFLPGLARKHRSVFQFRTHVKQFTCLVAVTKSKHSRKGECFDLPMGDVVEDVRTVFEEINDPTIYIVDFDSIGKVRESSQL